MNHSFARKVDLSSLGAAPIHQGAGGFAPPAAFGLRPRTAAPLAGSGAESGVGAINSETKALVSQAVVFGVMYGGVVLAVKGSLLYGGLAFVGGPVVAAMALAKIL